MINNIQHQVGFGDMVPQKSFLGYEESLYGKFQMLVSCHICSPDPVFTSITAVWFKGGKVFCIIHNIVRPVSVFFMCLCDTWAIKLSMHKCKKRYIKIFVFKKIDKPIRLEIRRGKSR